MRNGSRRWLSLLVTVAAIASIALPLTVASATHCTQVQILSGRNAVLAQTVDVGMVGCALPEHTNTDLILPGSNALLVRWNGPTAPTSGTLDFVGLTPCHNNPNNCAGQDCSATHCDLAFNLGTLIDGSHVYTSWLIGLNQNSSLNGGTATATICFGLTCHTRAYETIQ